MCRDDPDFRITAAEAYVRLLWFSASVDPANLDEKLVPTEKMGVIQRVIRRWEKKPSVLPLLRGMGSRDDARASSAHPSLAMGTSWLPTHSV